MYSCNLSFQIILIIVLHIVTCYLTSQHLSPLLLPYCPQIANPDSVEGLVLINIDINARGWIDWAAQKVCLFPFSFFPFFNCSRSGLHCLVHREACCALI